MLSKLTWFALALSALASLIFISDALEQPQLRHKQHVNIGVLVDLHQGIQQKSNKSTARVLCGALNVHAFQQLAAVRWAVDIINNKSWPGEFAIDIVVHDTCGESGIAQSETYQMIKWAKSNTERPLIGVIVIGSQNNERIIDKPLETLNRENISAIVTSARSAELLLSKHPNVFTTSPDVSSVAESILALIHQLDSQSISVISSSHLALKRFEDLVKSKSIRAKNSLLLKKDSRNIFEAIDKFLHTKAGSSEAIVLLLEPSEVERLVISMEVNGTRFDWSQNGKQAWILGSIGVDEEAVMEWSSRAQMNLFLMQPHIAINPDFQSYFLSNVAESLSYDEASEETQEYIEKVYHCQWTTSRSLGKFSSYPPCGHMLNSAENLAEKFHSEPDIGYIISAVSTYSAALRLAQLETCKSDKNCANSNLSTSVVSALRKFNFPMPTSSSQIPVMTTSSSESDDMSLTDDSIESTVALNHELEGTRGRINHEGKLVGRKYDLFLSKPNGEIKQIGQFSSGEGLVLDVMLGLPKSVSESNLQDLISGSVRPLGRRGKISPSNIVTKNDLKGSKGHASLLRSEQTNSEVSTEMDVEMRMMSPPEYYISRMWAMVVVAVGITGVFLAMYMLVYVLLRMCDGTLHGNQVLGILLLLGVMMMYASVVMFVLPPGQLLCNLRIFLPSLSTALCFGILLLKAMQLRSLVSLGLGGRISALNQFVTLLFIVAVQFAIDLQWSLTRRPDDPKLIPEFVNECYHPHRTYLFLHSYIGLLVTFVFIYGMSVLKIRRNYNEARWVTLAALLSIPVGIGWTLVVFFRPGSYQEPAACVVFVLTATVILFSIFIPKLSTISKQSNLAKRKKMLQQTGPEYTGSISTIFTTLSDRGHGTLQSLKRASFSRAPTCYPPAPPPMPHHGGNHGIGGKSVSYSPRLTTNIFNSSSAATSLARSVSMKTPFLKDSSAYP